MGQFTATIQSTAGVALREPTINLFMLQFCQQWLSVLIGGLKWGSFLLLIGE